MWYLYNNINQCIFFDLQSSDFASCARVGMLHAYHAFILLAHNTPYFMMPNVSASFTSSESSAKSKLIAISPVSNALWPWYVRRRECTMLRLIGSSYIYEATFSYRIQKVEEGCRVYSHPSILLTYASRSCESLSGKIPRTTEFQISLKAYKMTGVCPTTMVCWSFFVRSRHLSNYNLAVLFSINRVGVRAENML